MIELLRKGSKRRLPPEPKKKGSKKLNKEECALRVEHRMQNRRLDSKKTATKKKLAGECRTLKKGRRRGNSSGPVKASPPYQRKLCKKASVTTIPAPDGKSRQGGRGGDPGCQRRRKVAAIGKKESSGGRGEFMTDQEKGTKKRGKHKGCFQTPRPRKNGFDDLRGPMTTQRNIKKTPDKDYQGSRPETEVEQKLVGTDENTERKKGASGKDRKKKKQKKPTASVAHGRERGPKGNPQKKMDLQSLESRRIGIGGKLKTEIKILVFKPSSY